MKANHKLLAILALGIGLTMQGREEYPINTEVSGIGGFSSSTLAPYYVMSNNHGVLTQGKDIIASARVWHEMQPDKRFCLSYGVNLTGGYANSTRYLRYDPSTENWDPGKEHPARFLVQELYAQVKYRGVFLMAGLREYGSALLNQDLSSGDLVESGNARPIPQARMGFIDFQNVPLTRGWVQIQGEIAYGKPSDDDWVKNHYNYYNYHINQGSWYTYKRCYFRSRPAAPLSVTAGMQTAGQFGGTSFYYRKGVLYQERKFSRSIKQFLRAFIPTDQHSSEASQALGSWDLMVRYRFPSGAGLKAYMQKPWEDGSGIGFGNGFDGLWGLEYSAPRKDALVSGAVIEYVDFTNQSGPMHWYPTDQHNSTITGHAGGRDDYYNNGDYNSYAYYGMSLGTPFTPSPIYNRDGYPAFACNRVRGFHAALRGRLSRQWRYRLMGGYRKGYGTPLVPLVVPVHETSLMAEAVYTPLWNRGLSFKGQLALDRGSMLGNNVGFFLTVSLHSINQLFSVTEKHWHL